MYMFMYMYMICGCLCLIAAPYQFYFNIIFFCPRTQYYLTWRDMSTQNGILSKFDSKKLWTVPSKDQYLPSYFKSLCDHYLKETNPRRVYPVEVSDTVDHCMA